MAQMTRITNGALELFRQTKIHGIDLSEADSLIVMTEYADRIRLIIKRYHDDKSFSHEVGLFSGEVKWPAVVAGIEGIHPHMTGVMFGLGDGSDPKVSFRSGIMVGTFRKNISLRKHTLIAAMSALATHYCPDYGGPVSYDDMLEYFLYDRDIPRQDIYRAIDQS